VSSSTGSAVSEEATLGFIGLNPCQDAQKEYADFFLASPLQKINDKHDRNKNIPFAWGLLNMISRHHSFLPAKQKNC
jgi:hypothetical protein